MRPEWVTYWDAMSQRQVTKRLDGPRAEAYRAMSGAADRAHLAWRAHEVLLDDDKATDAQIDQALEAYQGAVEAHQAAILAYVASCE